MTNKNVYKAGDILKREQIGVDLFGNLIYHCLNAAGKENCSIAMWNM